MVYKLKELKNKHLDQKSLIIGTGSSILDYKKEIIYFIKENNPIIIGINNITSFTVPHYHLWTNNGRLEKFGNCIHKSSTLLLGKNIKKDLKKDKDYIEICYKDKIDLPIKIKDQSIQGNFRTAGCLAICLAFYMGLKPIYIVGMDGYTYVPTKFLQKRLKGQHFYGTGLTDNNSWEICKQKDEIVKDSLNDIKEYGIDFKIITPTVFTKHYIKIL